MSGDENNDAIHFFYPGIVPTPQDIALEILPTGRPGKRTIVIKLKSSSSTSVLGQYSTFTYTIENPFNLVVQPEDDMLEFTWNSAAGVNYTIESTSSLNTPDWQPFAPHINLPGVAGTMTRSVTTSGPTGFFRVKAAW